MSMHHAISFALERRPDLRPEGLAQKVLQWYICRMEWWFVADADTISLKYWDQEQLLPGGRALMVRGNLSQLASTCLSLSRLMKVLSDVSNKLYANYAIAKHFFWMS